jgi:hypothetical protein
MPTSVAAAFQAAGLEQEGCVQWGTTVEEKGPGIYAVALTSNYEAVEGVLPAAPLAPPKFERWLEVCPKLVLDRLPKPSAAELMERVGQFWLPDETIVYIGRATRLAGRVRQYYQTEIGARRPHSGGYFLKLLSSLDDLWIHYATAKGPAGAEHAALEQFVASVSARSRKGLIDPGLPIPFANLEWPAGTRKKHGLKNARAKA